ncbi:MAG: DUF3800 domain-containing protein [Candidatus Caldarchaeum sp.]|nr:DUF3800 domain-containing protein [Candidatus Caldarchaeum sp.]MCS7137029.1 DUF3800 domain-containing protein [Candidatus Caldarchaeum sp.]MDW8360054.1 DUF3800 domain-containing protein [Candidatus Caldarchaeum sp.]
MFVYIDEAGDLGFGPKSSKFFIVANLILRDPWILRKSLKRLRKRLAGDKRFSGNEFKFSRDSNYVKKHVLETICSKELDVGVVVVEKSSVKEELRQNPKILYNYLIVHYAIKTILGYNPGSVNFVLDKSLHEATREEFERYLQDKMVWKFFKERGHGVPTSKITHMNSQDEVCLQAADYIAGACFRKYERGDDSFYQIISQKIKFRNSWGRVEW